MSNKKGCKNLFIKFLVKYFAQCIRSLTCDSAHEWIAAGERIVVCVRSPRRYTINSRMCAA